MNQKPQSIRIRLTSSLRKQILKDVELIRELSETGEIVGAHWHLFPLYGVEDEVLEFIDQFTRQRVNIRYTVHSMF